MSFAGPMFILAIIALCYGGWIINNWVRARHGYDLEDEWGGKTKLANPDIDRQIELLSSENENLRGKIGNLEERIAVLERIVTDSSSRLSDEIENLR